MNHIPAWRAAAAPWWTGPQFPFLAPPYIHKANVRACTCDAVLSFVVPCLWQSYVHSRTCNLCLNPWCGPFSRWKVFTGNELAALLGWWMLFNWKQLHPNPTDAARVCMLATTVSSKILQAFARVHGFQFEVGAENTATHAQYFRNTETM